jgi:hypothetical protein
MADAKIWEESAWSLIGAANSLGCLEYCDKVRNEEKHITQAHGGILNRSRFKYRHLSYRPDCI